MPSPVDDNSDKVTESYYYHTWWCHLTLSTPKTAVELVAITASMTLATTLLAEEHEKWKMLAKLLYGSPPNQRKNCGNNDSFVYWLDAGRTISTLALHPPASVETAGQLAC
jgi:hypothetical protein